MHGIRKLLFFCTMITVLPSMLIFIPLYLRHIVYKDLAYAVTESDIMEINDGISTIFCSEHTLRMNSTFNAFQMAHRPEITSKRKHIRLKKSMNLPDDTLEYWGFYLLKGASVSLTVCSRFEGASILVVKGERNLRTCGLLEHNFNKDPLQDDIFLPGANKQVKIYESNAQEIDSKEFTVTESFNVYNINNNTHELSVNISSKSSVGKIFDDRVNINDNNNNNITNDNNNQVHTATSYERKLEDLYHTAASYIHNRVSNSQKNANNTRKLRHTGSRKMKKNKDERRKQGKKHFQEYEKKMHVQELKQKLDSHIFAEKNVFEQQEDIQTNKIYAKRFKRSRELIKPPSLLDQGIRHGGNADKNFSSYSNEVSSISSFETGLLNCYNGAILLAYEFEPSDLCTNIYYLLSGRHTQANHNVEEDGYYYYIFYSDNDIVSNDMYAIFDIYKPTFQYENVTKSCINQTECSFFLSPLSGDRVIVEIPTKDGIENDETDDISMLISVCKPRMAVYMIFPIAILLIILGCASI
ncbi:protein PFF0380w isoform X2 [Pseudomyrmex gracilis]|nr:protein PFF0380w isoform X2 [Pseudomyrmex gracilis]XP_020284980.1 protein PFF0380w isoform X2 [Pseudomyrmex gracilis]